MTKSEQNKNSSKNQSSSRNNLIKATVQQTIESFSGPLPHPEILKIYNEIISDGADRIMTLTEKQTEHRQKLENKEQDIQHKLSARGQNFAFILSILLIIVTGYAIFEEAYWVSGILGAGTMTSLVLAFLRGKKSQENDIKELRMQDQD